MQSFTFFRATSGIFIFLFWSENWRLPLVDTGPINTGEKRVAFDLLSMPLLAAESSSRVPLQKLFCLAIKNKLPL